MTDCSRLVLLSVLSGQRLLRKSAPVFFVCVCQPTSPPNNFNPFLLHILGCVTTETGHASSPPSPSALMLRKRKPAGRGTLISLRNEPGGGLDWMGVWVTCTDLHETKLTVPDPKKRKRRAFVVTSPVRQGCRSVPPWQRLMARL